MPARVQLATRRAARRLLGWDSDQSTDGQLRVARAIRQAASDLLVASLMDIALRYEPIVRYLEPRLTAADRVLEVGSGPVGITPYMKRPVVGVDRTFAGPQSRYLQPVVGDILDLQFADKEFAAVLCVDVMEHLEPNDRPAAVREVLRVARRWAVIAFPSGEAAAQADRELDSYLRRRLGRSDPFLVEHIANSLPSADSVVKMVKSETSDSGRSATVTVQGNVNVAMWLRVNRSKARLWQKTLQILAFPLLFRKYRAMNAPPCYRQIIFVEFES